MDLFLKLETYKIPNDPEIQNHQCALESDDILLEKALIDPKYKHVQYLTPPNIMMHFKYFKYSLTVNAYKVQMIAYLLKMSYDDAFRYIIRLTWENLFTLKDPISSPKDIALLLSNLKSPPNWTFLTWVMTSCPAIEFLFINACNYKDVRLYQPYIRKCSVRRIMYYNYTDITLVK